MEKIQKNLQNNLLNWFRKNKRPLPWRTKKDPYSIWISEVMLQQTTSKAVIPYYKKFLKKFPNVKTLSKAKKEDVFLLWAGLGYYNRAKNLIKAAKQIAQQDHFPDNHKDLLLLPGFGPYTCRAVSSLAFGEAVGVLDGNVIRFLSRFYGKAFKHWKAQDRKQMQQLADLWVQNQNSGEMNQSLMEIGSLICTSQNPACLLCPLTKNCQSFKDKTQHKFPIKKQKKDLQMWHWRPKLMEKKSQWAFIKNKTMPFLKNKLVFPGRLEQIKSKPKKYDFQHSITHYQIFVTICKTNPIEKNNKDFCWLTKKQMEGQNPSSLLKKVFSI